MKIILQVISLSFILTSANLQAQLKTVQQILENIDSQIVKITVDELAKRMEEDSTFYLIDVRTEAEYLTGHIQNAVWIPRGLLEFRIQKVTNNPEAEIVVYCKAGGRSALSAYTLGQMGYKNVFNLEGGLKEWVLKGNSIYNELGEMSVIDFEKLEIE